MYPFLGEPGRLNRYRTDPPRLFQRRRSDGTGPGSPGSDPGLKSRFRVVTTWLSFGGLVRGSKQSGRGPTAAIFSDGRNSPLKILPPPGGPPSLVSPVSPFRLCPALVGPSAIYRTGHERRKANILGRIFTTPTAPSPTVEHPLSRVAASSPAASERPLTSSQGVRLSTGFFFVPRPT